MSQSDALAGLGALRPTGWRAASTLTQPLLSQFTAPMRMLSVGPDIPLLAELSAAGHVITRIAAADFVANPASEQWPVLLLVDSAELIDSVDLFERAGDWLAADGRLLIAGTFLLRRDRPGCAPHHYLEHCLRLAERAGFAETLRHELPLAANNAATATWPCGDFLLGWQRREAPTWRLGRIGSERVEELRRLFAQVFGHDMSLAHWQWKYGDGRGIGIGVWRCGEGGPQLVAHYGGVSRDILLFGTPAKALQCGDVMVAEQGRGSLSRKGPVFLASATCLEHSIGYGTPQLIAFGFPNERAYRLPERLGLYAESGHMVEAAWPPADGRPSLWYALREIDPADPQLDRQLDACWAAMARTTGHLAIGVRDAAYLRYRYLGHPDKTYRLFVLKQRLTGRVLGAIVLRVDEDAAGTRRCELLDVVGAVAHVPLLVQQARRLAGQWGCLNLFAWLTENLLPYLALPSEASSRPIGIVIPANAWTAGPPVASFAGKWWLTSGDMDFR